MPGQGRECGLAGLAALPGLALMAAPHGVQSSRLRSPYFRFTHQANQLLQMR